MNRHNRYTFAGSAIFGLLLLSVTAFAAGLTTRSPLVDTSRETVGSVSAKNSNLGNFVINVSLQEGEPNTQFFVDVEGNAAGTFFTNNRGRGGVLYVLDGVELHGSVAVTVTGDGGTPQYSAVLNL